MTWDEVPFEDIFAEPSRNGVYKSKEHHGTGTKIVNMGELFAYDVIGDQHMNRLRMSAAELEKSALADGDLLFGRRSLVEAGAGKCSLVEGLKEPTTFESSIIRVRPRKDLADSRFLYYWFRSPVGRGRIFAIVTGTNVKGIRGSDLKRVCVALPPRSVQDWIVDKIKPYDDLIDNNRRRIALLKEAARLLYREWFVQFRFPGHEHVKIIDGVPEGWERKRLGDIAATNPASYNKGSLPDPLQYVEISSVAAGRINQKTCYQADEAPGRARRKAQHLDIIWSNVRPNLRGYSLVMHPEGNDVFSTGFTVLRARNVPASYLYFSVTTDSFVGHLVNHATGASYPAVRPDDFERAELLVPPEDILADFDEFCSPIFEQLHKLDHVASEAVKARDLLLPRLMDGRLEI